MVSPCPLILTTPRCDFEPRVEMTATEAPAEDFHRFYLIPAAKEGEMALESLSGLNPSSEV